MAEKIREFVNICGKSASKWTRMDLNFARHTRPAIYENSYRNAPNAYERQRVHTFLPWTATVKLLL